MKELVIDAVPGNLDTVLDFVNEKLKERNCTMKLQTEIDIAVEEIFVNIAHYAYNPTVGGAVIRVSAEEEIVIEFEDNGTAYNPLIKEDPDITINAEERSIGGLGIFMVKEIMDSVEYEHKNNNNILRIRKKII